MSLRWPKDRRDFLVGSGVICAGLAIPGVALAGPGLPAEVLEEQKGKKEKGRETEEISPAEDLMREHGLLNRILLIYEEGSKFILRRRVEASVADVHQEGRPRQYEHDLVA